MALLEKQIQGLTKDLSQMVSKLSKEVTPKSVHRLRTTIRRIESAVSYSNPDLGKKLERSVERLAELRKRAGKVRDIDVQARLLDQIANRSTARDRKTLTDLLEKRRNRQASRLSSALTRFADAKFFARMERIAVKVGAGPSQPNRPLAPLEEARLQLARMAGDFSSRHAITPNRLHKARIELKKIRYLVELADESPERQALLAELKSVQDAVGQWHDWQELNMFAEDRFGDRTNCALLREVRALLAAQEAAATLALGRLFAGSVTPERKPPRAAYSSRMHARRA
jgi:CHAD domain-containing protein